MPDENDLEFDLLLEAFENYRSAKKAHDKALNSYEGYSWGYYGAHYQEDLQKARSNLKKKFTEIVRSILS